MKRKETSYEKYVKRFLDIAMSAGALIVLSPVLGTTAILVRKKLGSPIFFSQERPGKDEKIFKLYKFRTMTDEKDPETGELLPDEVRLTPFGKKLRELSIDELPELWNILKGDMSIVGPRPLLVQYLPLYDERQHHRHDVRPGLTGYAQANGRNMVAWSEKFEMDVYYTEHISFWLDAKIVLQTALEVLRQDGISAEGQATVAYFTGNEETVEERVT